MYWNKQKHVIAREVATKSEEHLLHDALDYIEMLGVVVTAAAEWREYFARQPAGEVSFAQAQASSLAWEAFDCALRGEGPGCNPPKGDEEGDHE